MTRPFRCPPAASAFHWQKRTSWRYAVLHNQLVLSGGAAGSGQDAAAQTMTQLTTDYTTAPPQPERPSQQERQVRDLSPILLKILDHAQLVPSCG